MGRTTTWMGTRVLEGAGNRAAAAGRTEAREAKAKTRSCPGQTLSRRMSLRIQILMGKKRHHSFHPKPVTLLPTFRAPPGPSAADAEDEEDYDS
ncbi:Dr1 associated protein 1 (negative cofactor 2 alpha), isoform CRA_b [Mus musculus]|nr:Dr1 associated protein 1 (negative cofactor 2 alpha), isoform CRA_b [Mus musculus]